MLSPFVAQQLPSRVSSCVTILSWVTIVNNFPRMALNFESCKRTVCESVKVISSWSKLPLLMPPGKIQFLLLPSLAGIFNLNGINDHSSNDLGLRVLWHQESKTIYRSWNWQWWKSNGLSGGLRPDGPWSWTIDHCALNKILLHVFTYSISFNVKIRNPRGWRDGFHSFILAINNQNHFCTCMITNHESHFDSTQNASVNNVRQWKSHEVQWALNWKLWAKKSIGKRVRVFHSAANWARKLLDFVLGQIYLGHNRVIGHFFLLCRSCHSWQCNRSTGTITIS